MFFFAQILGTIIAFDSRALAVSGGSVREGTDFGLELEWFRYMICFRRAPSGSNNFSSAYVRRAFRSKATDFIRICRCPVRHAMINPIPKSTQWKVKNVRKLKFLSRFDESFRQSRVADGEEALRIIYLHLLLWKIKLFF